MNALSPLSAADRLEATTLPGRAGPAPAASAWPPHSDLAEVAPEIGWRLLDNLFAESATLAHSILALVALALLAWFRADLFPVLPWSAAAVLLGVWRWRLGRAYRARDQRPGLAGRGAKGWVWRYAAGAWCMGLLWGGGCALLLAGCADHAVQIIALQCAAGIAAGGALRNSPIRTVAKVQAALVLLPLGAAEAATGTPIWNMLSCFTLLYLAVLSGMVDRCHGQMRTLLLADEQNRAMTAQLASANARLQALTLTDALTGLANRRSFDARLAAEAARARHAGTELALLLLDVDHFKGFNDLHGHQAGDDGLRCLAAALRRAAGLNDLPARYGGEEFALILPGVDATTAAARAEALRGAVQALAIPHRGAPAGVLTVSIGVASLSRNATGAEELDQAPALLIGRADSALYAAKAAGRNGVVTWGTCTAP